MGLFNTSCVCGNQEKDAGYCTSPYCKNQTVEEMPRLKTKKRKRLKK